jgi:hypothetical protein
MKIIIDQENVDHPEKFNFAVECINKDGGTFHQEMLHNLYPFEIIVQMNKTMELFLVYPERFGV